MGILPMLAAPERGPKARPCHVAGCPEIEMRPVLASVLYSRVNVLDFPHHWSHFGAFPLFVLNSFSSNPGFTVSTMAPEGCGGRMISNANTQSFGSRSRNGIT